MRNPAPLLAALVTVAGVLVGMVVAPVTVTAAPAAAFNYGEALPATTSRIVLTNAAGVVLWGRAPDGTPSESAPGGPSAR